MPKALLLALLASHGRAPAQAAGRCALRPIQEPHSRRPLHVQRCALMVRCVRRISTSFSTCSCLGMQVDEWLTAHLVSGSSARFPVPPAVMATCFASHSAAGLGRAFICVFSLCWLAGVLFFGCLRQRSHWLLATVNEVPSAATLATTSQPDSGQMKLLHACSCSMSPGRCVSCPRVGPGRSAC